MNCESTINEVSLYVYGELTPEEEESFEDHMEACPACLMEVERLRAVGRALAQASMSPTGTFLAECRRDLMLAVERTGPGRRFGIRESLVSLLGPLSGLRQLGAAAVLVSIGFLAARFTSSAGRMIDFPDATPLSATVPATMAGFSPDGVVSGIRSVQPGPAGRVQIDLDETRHRLISGSPQDEQIQGLLLAAARDTSNPGLRVESIDILKDHPRSRRVRRALLRALARDPNPGVRLKALQGLKPLSAENEIRQAFTRALLVDDNPGVRIQVIEVLTENRDQELVGVLQELVQSERNNYVRLRCRDALREMNASVGAF